MFGPVYNARDELDVTRLKTGNPTSGRPTIARRQYLNYIPLPDISLSRQ